MYELIQAGPNTFYVECPAKVGLYKTGEAEAWLVDSGNDKDMARRLAKILAGQGLQLAGIVNTHSHADHIGGNAGLAGRTGCQILGPAGENALIQHTWLEGAMLYGGWPAAPLRNKFLLAQESTPTGTVEALPAGLTAVPLPGHSPAMCGVRTADDVLFVADAVFPQSTLEKYHIFYIYNVAAFLQTLDALEAMQARLFVPSHAAATDDIRPLVALNRAKVLEICDVLVGLCTQPASAEAVLAAVFGHYGLRMDMNQHVLVGSTVRGYLAHLCDTGRLEAFFEANRLMYRAI